MIVSLHKVVCDFCDADTLGRPTEKECEDAALRRGWLRRSVHGGMYHVCPSCRRAGKHETEPATTTAPKDPAP